ncbi:protein mono-ADP-ribosyltransferase PARP16 [Cloeon dipterum]|uniref:protein mono-ADP-ribosyltransferase PARP16 n=1 Tax=Cloeon dipterum TaxID=197152 RepID=UPI00322080E6
MEMEQNDTPGEPEPPQSNHGKEDLTISSSNSSRRSEVSFLETCCSLHEIMSSDLTALDFKWSLFVSAASSYKFDSCLRPFPSQFIKDGEKDIDAVRNIIKEMPPLIKLLEQLKSGTCQKETVELLSWILSQEPKLVTVPKNKHKEVLGLAPSGMTAKEPNLIIEVKGRPNDERWEQSCSQYKTMNAYHGSKLENFHSILRYGLQQHMNTTALFGAGIYLSSELGVSLHYSKTGITWTGSVLGNKVSCVALCKVLNHPDVKCQQGGSPEEVRSRSTSSDSLAGAIPKKYVLVRNSEHVRVCYILVYCKPMSRAESAVDSTLNWFIRNKFIILLLAYIFLLVAIGISNNHSIKRFIKRALKRYLS